MVAVLAPQPEPRRPALRVVGSTPVEPVALRRVRTTSARRESASVYRRRRAVVGLVLATAVVAVLLARSASSGTVDAPSVVTAASSGAPAVVVPAAAPAVAPRAYVVRPGDTVWSIAQKLRPEGDVRDLVDQLTERAGGSGLQAGQRIALDGLAV